MGQLIFYIIIMIVWAFVQRVKIERPHDENITEEIDKIFAKYPVKAKPPVKKSISSSKKVTKAPVKQKIQIDPTILQPAAKKITKELEHVIPVFNEKLTPENLRKGMIYSIILGMPKAKQRFSLLPWERYR
ncbi:MAG: hypothetical protein ABH952_07130 [Candidatus Omnitrophota bacterium]